MIFSTLIGLSVVILGIAVIILGIDLNTRIKKLEKLVVLDARIKELEKRVENLSWRPSGEQTY